MSSTLSSSDSTTTLRESKSTHKQVASLLPLQSSESQLQQEGQQQQQQQLQPVLSSSSTDRGLAHIHFRSWLFYVGVAAAIKTSILHPLTVAMARKRVLEEHASLRTVLLNPERIHTCNTTTCRGMLQQMNKASVQRRIRFMYRGFGVAIVANVCGEMIYFGILEYIRFILEGGKLDSLRTSIGGSAAELVALTLCTPLSVICHRQMTSGFGVASNVGYGTAAWTFRDVIHHRSGGAESSGNSSAAAHRTQRSGEVKRLFAGLSVALTALPAAAIWWGLYTQLKLGLYSLARDDTNILTNSSASPSSLSSLSSSSSSSSMSMSLGSTRDNPLINGASGITASVVTTILFNPFNVVRTRMQAGGGSVPGQPGKQLSGLKIASMMLKNEGPRAFMKGAVVSSWSAALEGSLVSSIYEYTKWLSDHTVWGKN